MATIATSETSAEQRERRFYFIMSLVFLAAAVAGFGFFIVIGASSFVSPWWVHVHAVTMTAFLALYVAQNWLVFRGEIATHRKLGKVGAILAVWLVAYSAWVITKSIAFMRYPPFFTANFFLTMDWLNLVVFSLLAGNGLRLRSRPDWHKRLMFGGMLSLLSVAWGRLVLPIFFDQRAIALVMAILLAHLGAAMQFDRRAHGRVHPAHFWTGGALVAWLAAIFTLSDLPPVIALAQSFAG